VFGAGLIPWSKHQRDLHCSWKSTPVVLEKHTYPETSYFSVLLEKHTLRSGHPEKAHLLSWKSTPILKRLIFRFSWKSTPFARAILKKHTCCPEKVHLLSWKSTPVVLEKHTCCPGKAHRWPRKVLISLQLQLPKILKIR
jgi:hypothetical protein